MMQQRLLSRVEAAEYLVAKGQPVAVATLAKYATIGGGPTQRAVTRAAGRHVACLSLEIQASWPGRT